MTDALRDEYLLYSAVMGSHAYGLNVAGSDEDRKGVYMPSLKEYMGLSEVDETITGHEPDFEYHVLGKYMRLLYKQNPTVLETLFVDDRFVEVETEAMKLLKNEKEMFLSKRAYYSIYGYAKEQLMRLKKEYRGLNEDEMEHHGYHVLDRVIKGIQDREESVLGSGVLEVRKDLMGEGGVENLFVDVKVRGAKFKQLYKELSDINDMIKGRGKVRNRNRRADKKRMYKHAMHLVRLLKMGREILTEKRMTVYREVDREELLAIRKGDWELDELFAYVDELFKETESVMKESTLVDEIDYKQVERLYGEMTKKHYQLKW